MYPRMPDILVEFFAGTYICDFCPNRKYLQNIVPANNSNNKVDLIFLSLKNTSLIISSHYVAVEKIAGIFSA